MCAHVPQSAALHVEDLLLSGQSCAAAEAGRDLVIQLKGDASAHSDQLCKAWLVYLQALMHDRSAADVTAQVVDTAGGLEHLPLQILAVWVLLLLERCQSEAAQVLCQQTFEALHKVKSKQTEDSHSGVLCTTAAQPAASAVTTPGHHTVNNGSTAAAANKAPAYQLISSALQDPYVAEVLVRLYTVDVCSALPPVHLPKRYGHAHGHSAQPLALAWLSGAEAQPFMTLLRDETRQAVHTEAAQAAAAAMQQSHAGQRPALVHFADMHGSHHAGPQGHAAHHGQHGQHGKQGGSGHDDAVHAGQQEGRDTQQHSQTAGHSHSHPHRPHHHTSSRHSQDHGQQRRSNPPEQAQGQGHSRSGISGLLALVICKLASLLARLRSALASSNGHGWLTAAAWIIAAGVIVGALLSELRRKDSPAGPACMHAWQLVKHIHLALGSAAQAALALHPSPHAGSAGMR